MSHADPSSSSLGTDTNDNGLYKCPNNHSLEAGVVVKFDFGLPLTSSSDISRRQRLQSVYPLSKVDTFDKIKNLFADETGPFYKPLYRALRQDPPEKPAAVKIEKFAVTSIQRGSEHRSQILTSNHSHGRYTPTSFNTVIKILSAHMSMEPFPCVCISHCEEYLRCPAIHLVVTCMDKKALHQHIRRARANMLPDESMHVVILDPFACGISHEQARRIKEMGRPAYEGSKLLIKDDCLRKLLNGAAQMVDEDGNVTSDDESLFSEGDDQELTDIPASGMATDISVENLAWDDPRLSALIHPRFLQLLPSFAPGLALAGFTVVEESDDHNDTTVDEV